MRYHDNFDHLGEPVEQTAPWTLPDFFVCAFLVFVVCALLSGVIG